MHGPAFKKLGDSSDFAGARDGVGNVFGGGGQAVEALGKRRHGLENPAQLAAQGLIQLGKLARYRKRSCGGHKSGIVFGRGAPKMGAIAAMSA